MKLIKMSPGDYRKVAKGEKDKEVSSMKLVNQGNVMVDWTRLPDDTVIQVFLCLNNRDRASMSSTCRTWRNLGSSPFLWRSLDVQAYKFDAATALSLSSRCKNLQKFKFNEAEPAETLIYLKAWNLREIIGYQCKNMTDASLSAIAARHPALESLQLGPDLCELVTSDAIKAIAICCPNIKRLKLSGIVDINGDAINALAKHCKNLTEIAFLDCMNIDEIPLGNVSSLRLLSVAGTKNMSWVSASKYWSKLPNLIGLDISRTDVHSVDALRILSSLSGLKVLCALVCPHCRLSVSTFLDDKNGAKQVLRNVTDLHEWLFSFATNVENEQEKIFNGWSNLKGEDEEMGQILQWLEVIFSNLCLQRYQKNPLVFSDFWTMHVAKLLFSLLNSPQENVQEATAKAISTIVITEDNNGQSHGKDVEAGVWVPVIGIHLLLKLARCQKEGLQSAATKAIANLSAYPDLLESMVNQGGITILAYVTRSMNRLVVKEATRGLCNLTLKEEHKVAFIGAGGIKALIEVISKWSESEVLECAAGALGNLAMNKKCSIEIAQIGGVQALVLLTLNCNFEGVLEKAAEAIANIATHGDSESECVGIGEVEGAFDALVQLTRHTHEGVRLEATGALWNLSYCKGSQVAIAEAGGIGALVDLANSCSNSSPALQERVAGALWGLSVTKSNSLAIGRHGGVAPLVAMASFDVTEVQRNATGALWNLAFYPYYAFRIVDGGGVLSLVHIITSSESKIARFTAALVLACLYDERMNNYGNGGTSSGSTSKEVSLNGSWRKMALNEIKAFIFSICDEKAFLAVAGSSSPSALRKVAESVSIPGALKLECSETDIERLVAMLRNSLCELTTLAAFALLQLTAPSNIRSAQHLKFLQKAGGPKILRVIAASTSKPVRVKVLSRILLRNLDTNN